MWFSERVNMENIKLVSEENGQLKLISLSNRSYALFSQAQNSEIM